MSLKYTSMHIEFIAFPSYFTSIVVHYFLAQKIKIFTFCRINRIEKSFYSFMLLDSIYTSNNRCKKTRALWQCVSHYQFFYTGLIIHYHVRKIHC